MWIQVLLIAAILSISVLILRRLRTESHQALRRLFFGLFVVAAVLSVLFPQWLSWLANLVGVGRGTDLLLYALVVAFFVFAFTQYRRNSELQRQLTRVTRTVAVQGALIAEKGEETAESSELAKAETVRENLVTGRDDPTPEQGQAD